MVDSRARVDRTLPNQDARDLLALARDIADREIGPQAAEQEEAGQFPREIFALLSKTGLLTLPFPARYGGGGQPFEVYLQVLEEFAAARLTVGLGVSVHTLACHPLATFGGDEQRARYLPEMLGAGQLGAYCLSEPSAGSDPASLTTRAQRDGDTWIIDGAKAWVTHGGVADFYTVFARTADTGADGITAFLVPADAPGLAASTP
ncbi:acyl-CoA dehydrogenase family protein, partial [Dactylosporangium sp. NPDC049525]|uniref:acyl-CoA dehydrogenase family protein n=1 Tax=Dactylosporangium sp. NPDC049525 TaxID=3154730 RepID=UPI00341695F7